MVRETSLTTFLYTAMEMKYTYIYILDEFDCYCVVIPLDSEGKVIYFS